MVYGLTNSRHRSMKVMLVTVTTTKIRFTIVIGVAMIQIHQRRVTNMAEVRPRIFNRRLEFVRTKQARVKVHSSKLAGNSYSRIKYGVALGMKAALPRVVTLLALT